MAKRRTVDSLVKQQQKLCNSTVHFLPVEVKQGNHLEVHLSEEVGQLMHISHGSAQLSVVEVVQVANQESNFVCCCRGKDKTTRNIFLKSCNVSICSVYFDLQILYCDYLFAR